MTLFLLLHTLVGALIGVLINRAADNLPPPARRSLLVAPRCPYCDTPRTLLEQFGILSFALRRERCHTCSAPLSLRAPLVEIASGALFAFLASRYPFGLYLVAISFFSAVLLLLAVIDLEHKLILNVVVLPATLLALATSPIVMRGPDANLDTLDLNPIILALFGAGVGYGMTLLVYFLGVVFLRFVNRNRRNKINTVAFGMGDVKLAGFLGALIAFPAIFYALIYAILLGGIGAVVAIMVNLVGRRGYSAFMAIPYGPYLILAGWAFLVFGRELLHRILGW